MLLPFLIIYPLYLFNIVNLLSHNGETLIRDRVTKSDALLKNKKRESGISAGL